MALKIAKREFIEPTLMAVRWDQQSGEFLTRFKVGNEWQDRPVTEPFAIDVWMAQHGYEGWFDIDGKRTRKTVLASISDDLPHDPGEGYKPLYVVPINNRAIGTRELTLKGVEVTNSFVDLAQTFAENFVEARSEDRAADRRHQHA